MLSLGAWRMGLGCDSESLLWANSCTAAALAVCIATKLCWFAVCIALKFKVAFACGGGAASAPAFAASAAALA